MVIIYILYYVCACFSCVILLYFLVVFFHADNENKIKTQELPLLLANAAIVIINKYKMFLLCILHIKTRGFHPLPLSMHLFYVLLRTIATAWLSALTFLCSFLLLTVCLPFPVRLVLYNRLSAYFHQRLNHAP